jgi:hypothetical protein
MSDPGRFERPPRGRLKEIAVALALAGLVAACSSTSGPGVVTLKTAGPVASPSPTLTTEQAWLAYADCMREHGVPMADPQVKSDGAVSLTIVADSSAVPIDKSEYDAAETACRHFMTEAAGPAGPGASIDPALEDALLAYAKCMREHDVDMPDPQFSTGGGPISVKGGDAVDPGSATYQAADEACRGILGTKDGGGQRIVTPGLTPPAAQK